MQCLTLFFIILPLTLTQCGDNAPMILGTNAPMLQGTMPLSYYVLYWEQYYTRNSSYVLFLKIENDALIQDSGKMHYQFLCHLKELSLIFNHQDSRLKLIIFVCIWSVVQNFLFKLIVRLRQTLISIWIINQLIKNYSKSVLYLR